MGASPHWRGRFMSWELLSIPRAWDSMNLGRAWESTFLMVPRGYRGHPPPLWEPPLQICVALAETLVLLPAPPVSLWLFLGVWFASLSKWEHLILASGSAPKIQDRANLGPPAHFRSVSCAFLGAWSPETLLPLSAAGAKSFSEPTDAWKKERRVRSK